MQPSSPPDHGVPAASSLEISASLKVQVSSPARRHLLPRTPHHAPPVRPPSPHPVSPLPPVTARRRTAYRRWLSPAPRSHLFRRSSPTRSSSQRAPTHTGMLRGGTSPLLADAWTRVSRCRRQRQLQRTTCSGVVRGKQRLRLQCWPWRKHEGVTLGGTVAGDRVLGFAVRSSIGGFRLDWSSATGIGSRVVVVQDVGTGRGEIAVSTRSLLAESNRSAPSISIGLGRTRQ